MELRIVGIADQRGLQKGHDRIVESTLEQRPRELDDARIVGLLAHERGRESVRLAHVERTEPDLDEYRLAPCARKPGGYLEQADRFVEAAGMLEDPSQLHPQREAVRMQCQRFPKQLLGGGVSGFVSLLRPDQTQAGTRLHSNRCIAFFRDDRRQDLPGPFQVPGAFMTAGELQSQRQVVRGQLDTAYEVSQAIVVHPEMDQGLGQPVVRLRIVRSQRDQALEDAPAVVIPARIDESSPERERSGGIRLALREFLDPLLRPQCMDVIEQRGGLAQVFRRDGLPRRGDALQRDNRIVEVTGTKVQPCETHPDVIGRFISGQDPAIDPLCVP